MATQKSYIGSGKATKYNGVSVTLKLEDAQKFAFETERGTFLNFIVSPRKEKDERGRTHVAFVLVDADEPVVAQVAEPAVKKPSKKKQKAASQA